MNINFRQAFDIALCLLNNLKHMIGDTFRQVNIYWGRYPKNYSGIALIFFPFHPNLLRCGLAGLIAVHRGKKPKSIENLDVLAMYAKKIQEYPLKALKDSPVEEVRQHYLGGQAALDPLYECSKELKRADHFVYIGNNSSLQKQLAQVSTQLDDLIRQETATLQDHMGRMSAEVVKVADQRIEKLKDTAWCLNTEIHANIQKIRALMPVDEQPPTDSAVTIYHNINVVLNSIDRLEVRGRDSAGISLLFILDQNQYQAFEHSIDASGLTDELKKRQNPTVLGNGSICVHQGLENTTAGIAFTYKVAAEIGSLGDNVRYLRQSVAKDSLLYLLANMPHRHHTVSTHTRWASVGAISVANCHPMDSTTHESETSRSGIIHACLNGDIDNYLVLKKQWEQQGGAIPDEITTDTKIIPLQIEYYIRQGHPVEEAFRLAVNDFKGSHAISMHTDLAPGKFFLAQRGSGQSIFVGLAEDHYLPVSEVYGFVEKTSTFVKMDGEKEVEGVNGPTQGQIFVLNQKSDGGLEGIQSMYYDGTPIALEADHIQSTEIMSRDIDRQSYPHYFLKEISEAPLSVAKTLQNRWKVDPREPDQLTVTLDDTAFPEHLAKAFTDNRIQRIYFIGQGTAGIAAQAGADILSYYLNDPGLKICAMKASELSGFQLGAEGDSLSMADTLVIAISQSGTTTDTNRTVDMVKSRGASTMAIVNRRDSDITFKVDGVVYTSSGRDIEMSVASTKAFYSQIVAAALVGLNIARIKKRLSAVDVTEELKALLALPDRMQTVLTLSEKIKASAQRLAPQKTYWAAVGSGPNKAAADEIRIKLSELCYKTISSDFVEDKKHIDLSSEPLILVCAAGTGNTVIGDIIKDTAIFKAHKAAPVVITDEGESRFDPYAEDVFHVPGTSPHLSPILNTLVGHLWGYYAALALNNGSLFLHHFREDIQQSMDQYSRNGLDIYEILLEKSFREKMITFYSEFRKRQSESRIPSVMLHASDLMLLIKYLAGRLPVSDFEMDFGKKGTALNMIDSLFTFLGRSINGLSRPVDAIKHQAKTVTVGTSRISEKIEGIFFEALEKHGISTAQLINRNILVLKNLQGVVAVVNGSILYRIDGLNLLGELTDTTTITVLKKDGILKNLSSRVENDTALKGTKRIIVHQGNIYIGKGRKDDRSILVIPAISADIAASNRIEYLLLLNISFREKVSLPECIRALGGKYEHIKNIVQENSVPWQDVYLEGIPMDELFGRSAEKIGERIINAVNGK